MQARRQLLVQSDSAHLNEQFLLLFADLVERVVLTSQVAAEAGQSVHQHALHLAALGATDGRRQAKPAHAAARTHAARLDVLLVQLATFQL